MKLPKADFLKRIREDKEGLIIFGISLVILAILTAVRLFLIKDVPEWHPYKVNWIAAQCKRACLDFVYENKTIPSEFLPLPDEKHWICFYENVTREASYYVLLDKYCYPVKACFINKEGKRVCKNYSS